MEVLQPHGCSIDCMFSSHPSSQPSRAMILTVGYLVGMVGVEPACLSTYQVHQWKPKKERKREPRDVQPVTADNFPNLVSALRLNWKDLSSARETPSRRRPILLSSLYDRVISPCLKEASILMLLFVVLCIADSLPNGYSWLTSCFWHFTFVPSLFLSFLWLCVSRANVWEPVLSSGCYFPQHLCSCVFRSLSMP